MTKVMVMASNRISARAQVVLMEVVPGMAELKKSLKMIFVESIQLNLISTMKGKRFTMVVVAQVASILKV